MTTGLPGPYATGPLPVQPVAPPAKATLLGRIAGAVLILAALLSIIGSIVPVRYYSRRSHSYTLWDLSTGAGSTFYIGLPVVFFALIAIVLAVLLLVGLAGRSGAVRVFGIISAFALFIMMVIATMLAFQLGRVPRDDIRPGIAILIIATLLAFIAAVIATASSAAAPHTPPRPLAPPYGGWNPSLGQPHPGQAHPNKPHPGQCNPGQSHSGQGHPPAHSPFGAEPGGPLVRLPVAPPGYQVVIAIVPISQLAQPLPPNRPRPNRARRRRIYDPPTGPIPVVPTHTPPSGTPEPPTGPIPVEHIRALSKTTPAPDPIPVQPPSTPAAATPTPDAEPIPVHPSENPHTGPLAIVSTGGSAEQSSEPTTKLTKSPSPESPDTPESVQPPEKPHD